MPRTTVTGADFMHNLDISGDSELRIGSLFSGYGGLDLAVEHVFNASTVWFSELNEPVARVFAHHWPGAPNLGDITTIDWSQVEPVDILIGGFPCQDVSTVGKRAGLAPGTRSGLWALGSHGHSHRPTPTAVGRHRERPRAAVLTSDAATRTRRRL
ncbi:DNA cytosine methyltransferase [Nakamurella flavida]|uniref:DNA cytosine methyltransferase n=1 Tax=Nakamurella flavida TaxID=363630 RepID=A0A938YHM4_9ACTN|nr:DNA cytosine methyltransferase [Nakamurella flavida]MBM9474918.1 DNA cytosine methyltransferase [Nakamurella flavida]MDP9776487.1 hypothetical protein [Nakamurella flavida]